MSQAPVDGDARYLAERLRQVEEEIEALRAQRRGARLRSMLPPEVRQHLRAAQREQLLAVRALIDAAIKRTEEEPAPRRRAESVRID
ncbi:MAG TPA: hypothetical protein VFE42_19560 [Chloroflexota bacterium]|nr:hypothetical protein [Chloroflexota bacterium]